jgi:hypothetical protein
MTGRMADLHRLIARKGMDEARRVSGRAPTLHADRDNREITRRGGCVGGVITMADAPSDQPGLWRERVPPNPAGARGAAGAGAARQAPELAAGAARAARAPRR